MRSFKHVARACARLSLPRARRGGSRVAGVMAVVVVALAAVLAGSALVPGRTAGTALGPVPADRRAGAAPLPAPAPGDPPGGGPTGGASPGDPPGGSASPGDVRALLTNRLGEILRIRERAYARRDATLLDTIYTADCACLRSGRAAIARLLADRAVWRGRSVSVRVERWSRIGDSLWVALAVLRRNAFRIEREDGTLISAEPAICQRYRFALVRVGAGVWLLGHASLIEELPA